MPTITIQGISVEIPASGASPNWSPAIIQALQLLAQAVALTVGDFDIVPQTFNLDPYNSASSVDITNLSFPTNDVRSATMYYAVHRTTDSTEVDESGEIEFIYNDDLGSWNKSQEKTSNAQISFDITNTGQVQFSTTALSGLNHAGFITFYAKALTNE